MPSGSLNTTSYSLDELLNIHHLQDADSCRIDPPVHTKPNGVTSLPAMVTDEMARLELIVK
jgi:hypothetical protein